MKNFKWIFFFVVILILISPFLSLAQTPGVVIPEPGLFSKIGNWFQNNLLTLVGGSLFGLIPTFRRMWIKQFAHKGAIVMKQLGEICFASSDFMQVMDNSIKDDSTLAENSVSELMASGKNLIAETKDAIVTIKPKS